MKSAAETWVRSVAAAFTDAAGSEEQRLFVGGAANLLGEARSEDLAAYRPLLEALEQRVEIVLVARTVLETHDRVWKILQQQADERGRPADRGLGRRTGRLLEDLLSRSVS